jgi:iron complex transport system substrate-binding protein
MGLFLFLILSYRFISLVPSVTEIFYLLNSQDSLLAVSYYCNYPPETKKKQKVGDLLNPSYEEIIKLKPDFVIITLPMQTQVARNLEKLGIRYINFNPESLEEILTVIDSVSKLAGALDRGKFVMDSLKSILNAVRPTKLSPKVYLELSENPIYTVGEKSFLNDIVTHAGGKNIFDSSNQSYFNPNPEEIINSNPDFIFLLYPEGSPKKVSKRMGWQKINAVKYGRIYCLDPDLFTRPGPRAFEAVIKINRILILGVK